MILIDTNAIIDGGNPKAEHHGWARERLLEIDPDKGVLSPIVAAEFASGIADRQQYDRTIAALPARLHPLTPDAMFVAGRAFRQWIASGGRRGAMIADLLIGAQAKTLGATIVTRDTRRFRRYFPEIELITPDTRT